jgi:hypothetical protein
VIPVLIPTSIIKQLAFSVVAMDTMGELLTKPVSRAMLDALAVTEGQIACARHVKSTMQLTITYKLLLMRVKRPVLQGVIQMQPL